MWAFGQEYLSLNISNTLALGMGLNSGLDYIYCAWILNGGCSPISPLCGDASLLTSFMGDTPPLAPLVEYSPMKGANGGIIPRIWICYSFLDNLVISI